MSLNDSAAAHGADTAASSATAKAGTTHGDVALGRIALSPTNPRTSHGRSKLLLLLDDNKVMARVGGLLREGGEDARQDLATVLGSEKFAEFVISIYAHGVNQPVLLRPLPGSRIETSQEAITGFQRPDLELVSGERRCFGSLLAGHPHIPAMVKAMSDQEVLEFQLVENLQREDLHPMEEAEGYERLCRDTGVAKEDIGGKVGKSRSYVYARLKLLDLCQEAREAFFEGKVDASNALKIARIPDQKLQLKALKEVTSATMSVRDFERWLQQNVMLRLDRATFKITSEELLPDAGSCRACPKRTGAEPELFVDVDSADICTDPKCFHKKEDAHRAQIRAAAEAKGLQVIDGKEAKELRPVAYHGEISGYLDLDKPLPGAGDKPLRKLLGKDAPAEVVFIDPHTHEARNIVPAVEARKVLKAKGVAAKVPKQRAEQDEEFDRERKKREIETRIEETWRMRAAREIVSQARAGSIGAFSGPVLRLILEDLLEAICDGYHPEPRLERTLVLWNLPTDVEPVDALTNHIKAADELELGPMLIGLLLSGDMEFFPSNPSTLDTPALKQLASEVGVDVVAIAAEVKKEIRAEEAAAIKAQKAQDAKKAEKGSATTPLAAQAGGETEGKPAVASAPAAGKKPRTKAPKLSAHAAKQGIADAMQEMEPTSEVDLAKVSAQIDPHAVWPFPLKKD